ncbi:MAG: MiaB/RimO family radical SAM methylthiotransferase [Candidatus Falkowbacteria bacterium]|nr:MiaB/RimO family radical SAM methylthiotransferase [Candidatus Falkowbacteria bacterium]
MKTYHIITIGCQMNKSDSERIAGYLEECGLKFTNERNKADLVIINTCGVRQSAEDRVYGLAPKIKKENKQACPRRQVKLVIAGCLTLRPDVKKRLGNLVDLWLPIVDLPKLADFLHLKNNQDKYDYYLKIQPKYESNFTAYVPIGNGCNNFCTYCVVPAARGKEIYRPAEEILAEVKYLVNKGYKEITLIAQNVNSYFCHCEDPASAGDVAISRTLHGTTRSPRSLRSLAMTANKKVDFSDLLKMVNDIPGKFWIRFATSHPKDMNDKLIKTIANCEKACHHIHLPVQSGNNKILRAMNRNYTVEHYVQLIKKIRQAMPDVAITTDVIVGFPGETKKQFLDTVKLFKIIKFDMAYIAQYSARPDTTAAKLVDNVSKPEKKSRAGELTKVLQQSALANNKKYVGKETIVLINGKARSGDWQGYTRTYKNVKIKSTSKNNLVNQFRRVKIERAYDFGLSGILVKK